MRRDGLIIIGLGNEYISDDGVGICAVRRLKTKISLFESNHGNGSKHLPSNIVIEELATGGLQLIDYLVGREKCIIIDAVMTGTQPTGAICRYVQRPEDEPVRLVSSHQVHVSEILGLAEMLGVDAPREIIIYGIEANDVTTFSKQCSVEVRRALPRLVDLVFQEIMTGNTVDQVRTIHPAGYMLCESYEKRQPVNLEVGGS